MRRQVEANKANQGKKKLPVVHDPSVVDDAPIYAQANKKPNKAKDVTEANGRKGESPTRKGRESLKSPLLLSFKFVVVYI